MVRESDGEARVDAKGKVVLQMVVVTDIVAHLKHKAERIRQWMSREGLEDERKWMTDTESAPGVSLLSPFCQDTAHGRELRERVIRGETAAAEGTVPIQFWPVLVAAKADDKVLSNTEFNKVNRRHTRGEFRRAVRGMANGSAPGKSGLSYAELKCMSDDMLDLLSDLCNISVESGVVFSDWCEEIVYMIPKESGVALL